MTYFLIIQNTQEIIELKNFDSLIDAEKSVAEHEDHLTHGERWVIVDENFYFKSWKTSL